MEITFSHENPVGRLKLYTLCIRLKRLTDEMICRGSKKREKVKLNPIF